MNNKNTNAIKFIQKLLDMEQVRELEQFTDQGVKVSTHTYDVLKLSIDEIKRDFSDFFEAKKKVEFFSLIVGIIVHDLSKGTLRKLEENISHSQVMLKNPEYIINETNKILNNVEIKLDLNIKDSIKESIVHIVISHHGRWGKIQPNTKEANIVHRADVYSAKYHRINPVGADKILEMFINGIKLDEIAKKLDCTEGIIKNRLNRAKEQLNFRSTKQLINYYKENKTIPIGDHFFIQRVKETEKLKRIVDKKGFKNIVLEVPLLKYLIDDEIFEKN
ncbi:MAG: HD domain-containing protein [Fusobacteriaceae bacterium]|nr:HD domain-containing protein [Fusobacteriaceae bacterium]